MDYFKQIHRDRQTHLCHYKADLYPSQGQKHKSDKTKGEAIMNLRRLTFMTFSKEKAARLDG